MSLKQLHACITDLFIEWHKEHPKDPYLHRLHSKLQILLDGYDIHPKGERVCIPRKQLEERIVYLESQFQPHDVCCVPCLEKGQIIELKKLLEESK